MSSLPTNNTTFKRRLIQPDEEESGFLSEQERAEISSEIQYNFLACYDCSSEELPKKARRGRPSKKGVLVESPVAGSSELTSEPTLAFVGSQSSSSINVSEIDLALKALEYWKDFCEKNRHRYPADPQYPYTVGPTEFVVAFFQEFIFKRTYKKRFSVETDIRTQIGLRTDENEKNQLSLLQNCVKTRAFFTARNVAGSKLLFSDNTIPL